jgi:hypothetical protein
MITTASLLLCAVVMVLWARSYHRSDAVRMASPRVVRYAVLYSGRGGIMVGVSPAPTRFAVGVHYMSETEPGRAGEGPPVGVVFDAFGFGARAERPPYAVAAYTLWLPHWFAALLLSVLPARLVMARHARGDRERRGLCRACGYDLRHTPQRCPECGAVAAKAAAA